MPSDGLANRTWQQNCAKSPKAFISRTVSIRFYRDSTTTFIMGRFSSKVIIAGRNVFSRINLRGQAPSREWTGFNQCDKWAGIEFYNDGNFRPSLWKNNNSQQRNNQTQDNTTKHNCHVALGFPPIWSLSDSRIDHTDNMYLSFSSVGVNHGHTRIYRCVYVCDSRSFLLSSLLTRSPVWSVGIANERYIHSLRDNNYRYQDSNTGYC